MAIMQPNIQQISLSSSAQHGSTIEVTAASKDRQEEDIEVIRKHVIEELGEPPAFNIHERLAPFNICPSQPFAA
jgi:hypothetical protein